ncbi:MAG TPA: hypothetical protein PKX80_01240 [Flexilinea sp.]|nr:MAG: 16S rRNA (guanine(1405)-N(7))-methyltransferase [Chloroflexi bacterium ADurb.Bin344]HOR55691.1 hypothetical protein [Flexilinea sp.]HQG88115.1 hypothetical protein [Flexilinea sp.]
MENDSSVLQIAAEISAGKNFREIDPGLILHLVKTEMQPNESEKETVKRVRSKLHQISNAYREGASNYQDLITAIRQSDNSLTSLEAAKPLAIELMKSHASTRERIAILDVFYSQIFAALPPIQSVLDLACGLNPLAIPWMKLADHFTYEAYDIYRDIALLLNVFFEKLNIRGKADSMNLLEEFPQSECDLTFLLKTIPCLEQVDKNAGTHILNQIRSPYAVVSFPIFSLSGRQKGMKVNYEKHFLEIYDPQRWELERMLFPNELVFLMRRK